MKKDSDGLYIVLVSVHGLLRSENMELGRDADTGGQIKYVVELAKELSLQRKVARVDLLTRRIEDSQVDKIYSQELEKISEKAFIVRLPMGGKKYIRKELLWSYLDNFADHAVYHFKKIAMLPDIIHSHYADAGYIGARLSSILGLPLIHTGHSLGRIKKQRLIDNGMQPSTIEKKYHISKRIEAEEIALDSAVRVIASTAQEVKEQYAVYDNYHPTRMLVIPPGVSLENFSPPKRNFTKTPIIEAIEQFLKIPQKPAILALSRPDPRKNIESLIHAYGKNQELQEKANLVIVAGSRFDIKEMDAISQQVLKEILYLMDYYNLYGKLAIPKQHNAQDVPQIYQWAAKRKGVFVNPALTEPFGLTLLEAAASGLPVAATHDGGPIEIIERCQNGLLFDPLDLEQISSSLLQMFAKENERMRWAKNGLQGVHKFFSWQAHAKKYLNETKKVLNKSGKSFNLKKSKNLLPLSERLIISDIDNTLLGDKKALKILLKRIKESEVPIGFGIATGRNIDSARSVLKEWGVPTPDVLITSVGSEIHYGPKIVEDNGWKRHIHHNWHPQKILKALENTAGITLQEQDAQRDHKISYVVDPQKAPSLKELRAHLRRLDLPVKLIFSHNEFLDVLPLRASKGLAVRYFALKWGVPLQHILVAGDSGNDEEMLAGNTLGVVVGNFSPELKKLKKNRNVFFANGHYANGIVEGVDHYNFFTKKTKDINSVC